MKLTDKRRNYGSNSFHRPINDKSMKKITFATSKKCGKRKEKVKTTSSIIFNFLSAYESKLKANVLAHFSQLIFHCLDNKITGLSGVVPGGKNSKTFIQKFFNYFILLPQMNYCKLFLGFYHRKCNFKLTRSRPNISTNK